MRLKDCIESHTFELTIITLVIVNAVVLGLQTYPAAMAQAGGLLVALDHLILGIFVVEVLCRIAVYRGRFFHDPWRVFDFLVVAVSLAPATGNLQALRVLRVFRLVALVPSLRRVLGGLITAMAGMLGVLGLLFLLFYAFAIMAVGFFGQEFPQWFGNLGASAYTLFQIMTLESWSSDIVRPLMEVFPLAPIFFIVFIVFTTFTVLNLVIGVIVSAMQADHDKAARAEMEDLRGRQREILRELRELRGRESEARGKPR